MAIKTKEELLTSFKNALGDNTDDATLSLFEDFADTYDDLSSKANPDGKDWKAEAEKIDKEWRQKYHDRFFNPVQNEPDPLDAGSPDPKPLRFEDLFSKGD